MFRTLSRSWKAFRRAGAADRLVALEMLVWLAGARMIVRTVPFRSLSRRLARILPASASSRVPEPAQLQRLGRVLNALGARVPWRCQCLERAIAGKLFLRVRGYPSTIFLGVSRRERQHELQAHAWLRCAGLPVVGEEGAGRDWSVVASFPDEAAPGREGGPLLPPADDEAVAPVVFPTRHR
ncbi:MAG TPA: lasso peptide biosynthesis B2 protein [Allosphingosinicella sp.]